MLSHLGPWLNLFLDICFIVVSLCQSPLNVTFCFRRLWLIIHLNKWHPVHVLTWMLNILYQMMPLDTFNTWRTKMIALGKFITKYTYTLTRCFLQQCLFAVCWSPTYSILLISLASCADISSYDSSPSFKLITYIRDGSSHKTEPSCSRGHFPSPRGKHSPAII